MSESKGTLAAKKAWVTRRKNAVSARQRKAGFKAWETRRNGKKSTA
jgi:hypothetical protein